MKALIYNGPGKIAYGSVPTPKIKPDEVLMRIKSVGICGTDLHIFRGGLNVPAGSVIGHEFSGEVAAAGSEVHHVKKGDRVIGEHVVSCGQCLYCKTGKPNMCSNAQVIGLHRPGALAEYLAIPGSLVYKIPDTISFDEAALAEPLSIAWYAVREAGYLLDKQVAVVGQGPIGLLVDQVLTAAGALVTGIDIRPHTIAFAKKNGWIRHGIVTTEQSALERIQKYAPDGYDVVFEVVGAEATAELSLEISRRNGTVFMLGVFASPARLNMMNIVKKELHVFGSWTCANSFPETIQLIDLKKVDLKSLITNVYPAKDGIKAFTEAANYQGHRLKSIINF
ncbi:MAG: alcohol dehydrogenase catalytic domain-containing protein [Patescibacteria group bacterium]